MTETNNDEINIKDLFINLYKNRTTIFLSIFSFLVLAIMYNTFATSYYKTNAKVSAISNQSLELINIYKIAKYSSEETSQKILFLIKSGELISEFANKNYKIFENIDKEYNKEEFLNKSLSINIPKNKSLDFKEKIYEFNIIFEHPKTINGKKILTEYITLLNKKLKHKMLTEFISIKSSKERDLNFQLDTLRFETKQTLKNEIDLLKEAHSLAKDLNIINPINPPLSNKIQKYYAKPSNQSKSVVKETSILEAIERGEKPLYTWGTKAIKARINSLETRKDPTIIDNRSTLIRSELYKIRQIDNKYNSKKDDYFSYIDKRLSDLQLVNITSLPRTESHPFMPKKSLVIALSLLIGLFIGMLIIYTKSLIGPQKEKNIDNNKQQIPELLS